MGNLIIVKETDESVLYALDGYKAGSKAVLVEWNYCTGTQLGIHNFADSYAISKVGHLDENLEFVLLESDIYTKFGISDGETLSKEMIGKPVEYDTWNPEEDAEDIDWDSMNLWMEKYCSEVLV